MWWCLLFLPSAITLILCEVDVRDIHDWIEEEVNLRRLAAIHGWLWIVRRPMLPRSLHQQRLLNREIVVTEKLDLHLVWATARIFIKPLPRFLFEPRFWAKFLRCHTVLVADVDSCGCVGRRECALGFLFSYVALIAHKSDFYIAKETHFIPDEVQWSARGTAIRQLLETLSIYPWINLRFYYGELRLSRLNKICIFWKTPLRGYLSRWNQLASRRRFSGATKPFSWPYTASLSSPSWGP
ncbi:hypothetical protein LX36DRAFT_663624 [Colletotrichum falcatum]|nr:hypothetical protein LX36DRAFT_663624 [Colletotrichum falcatum]